MSILSRVGKKIKSTFAPSAQVGASRRLATFGSTSKTKAAAIIVGTAALAALASVPAAAAAVGRVAVVPLVKTVSKFVISAAKKHPVITTGVVLASPTIIAAVAKRPDFIPKTAGAVIDANKGAIGVITGDSSIFSATKDFVVEHPIAAGVATAIGVIAVGRVAVPAAIGLSNTLAVKENTKAQSTPATLNNAPYTSSTPIARESINIPKTISGGTRKKRRATNKQQTGIIIKINNNNYNRGISNSTKRYINALPLRVV